MRFSYETVFKSRLLSLGPLKKAPLEITATQNKSITFFIGEMEIEEKSW